MSSIFKNKQNKGRLLMASTAVLWGLAGVCVKSIPWNAMSIMASRSLIATIMLGITRKSFIPRANLKTFLGALMMSGTGLLYMMSIKYTTAATAIVLQYVAPILVFLYTVVFQKKRPKFYEVLIIIAVFGGCLLSFMDDIDPTQFLGNILGLASGVTFAAQIIIFNDPEARSEDGAYLSNFMSFCVGLPFVFFDTGLDFSLRTIVWVLILGIFQYGFANICYAKGCQLIDKVEASLILTIEPIFNPIPVCIYNYVLVSMGGEQIDKGMGPKALIGFFIVIVAIIAYSLIPMLKNKREEKAKAAI